MRGFVLKLVLGLLLVVAAGSPASAADEADLLDQLGSPDPTEREAAQAALLQLDLEGLQDLADDLRSRDRVSPAWRVPLRRAVRHVHLRGAMSGYFSDREAKRQPDGRELDPELEEVERQLDELDEQRVREMLQQPNRVVLGPDQANGAPFLGVGSRRTMSRRVVPFDEEGALPGYVVQGLVPGFVASSVLRDGDVIEMIALPAADEQREWVRFDIRTFRDLTDVLRFTSAGQMIGLGIRRGDEFLVVRLVLDRRIDTTSIDWTRWAQAASQRADTFWREQFAPAFGDVEAKNDRPAGDATVD